MSFAHATPAQQESPGFSRGEDVNSGIFQLPSISEGGVSFGQECLPGDEVGPWHFGVKFLRRRHGLQRSVSESHGQVSSTQLH